MRSLVVAAVVGVAGLAGAAGYWYFGRATAPAVVGASTNIWGYGIDVTCTRSQTQQLSPGTITARLTAYYTFNNDVRGGNSGSGYLNAAGEVIGIVTHCAGGCGGR